MKTVTATTANRDFSKLLEQVARTGPVAITKRGKVVARIVPARDEREEEQKDAAWTALLERLRTQPLLGIPRGTRDELYDD